jgi:hypothetical protein
MGREMKLERIAVTSHPVMLAAYDFSTELWFCGHDAMHTYWNSDQRRAAFYESRYALMAELQRAGLSR